MSSAIRSGTQFQDMSAYGRGGTRGKGVRIVTVVSQVYGEPDQMMCLSEWHSGPLRGIPARRVVIRKTTLLSKRFVLVGKV